MKKRIISVFVCIALLFVLPVSVNAQTPQSTVIKLVPDTTSVYPGDVVTYTILFGSVYELGSIQMQLDIPQGLNYVAGSFNFETDLQNKLGFDYLYWTEENLMINGVASAKDYQSSLDTTIATFKCKSNKDYYGNVQTGLKNLEFASCVTNTITTSRFSVQSQPVTLNKARERVYFPDVNYNLWYGDSIDYVVSAGLMKGYSNGKFGTSDGIQRQDFVVILSRLSGDDQSVYQGQKAFKDVNPSAYYAPALAWAKATGVSKGYDNGKFGVGDKVTREQIMTFLYNYAKLKHYNTTVTDAEKAQIRSNYPDFSTVSGFAKEAAYWALLKGVVSGKQTSSGRKIAPTAQAQRCEVAKMFYNIHENNIFKE